MLAIVKYADQPGLQAPESVMHLERMLGRREVFGESNRELGIFGVLLTCSNNCVRKG